MFFDELQVGMTVDTEPAVIEKDKMMAFAHDYDNIPLHTDEEYAKKTPFGKLIAPGVMSFMSLWAWRTCSDECYRGYRKVQNSVIRLHRK